MAGAYTETPDNFHELEPFVETDIMVIKSLFYSGQRIFFYDACSFQRHSHYARMGKDVLIHFYKRHGTVIFITRSIMMELASDRHMLAEECIYYIKELREADVKVVIFNEEYTYDILSECFATNDIINQYLTWAVRTVKSPVSTIIETLKTNSRLYAEVIAGKNSKQSDIYRRFFAAVRANKEHGDNLGEELIAVCIHILSSLPGVADGKLCVMTDDRGAASKIDLIMKKTNSKYRGAKIILFSTPKLVQHIFQEQMDLSEEEMIHLLSQGTSGNIVVMGVTAYDLKVNEKISLTDRELAQKIMEPNGINIVF